MEYNNRVEMWETKSVDYAPLIKHQWNRESEALLLSLWCALWQRLDSAGFAQHFRDVAENCTGDLTKTLDLVLLDAFEALSRRTTEIEKSQRHGALACLGNWRSAKFSLRNKALPGSKWKWAFYLLTLELFRRKLLIEAELYASKKGFKTKRFIFTPLKF